LYPWFVSRKTEADGVGKVARATKTAAQNEPAKVTAATRSTDWCKILVLVEGGQGALIGLFLNQG